MRLTGSSVKRVEDPRILTGQGRFGNDVRLPGMLHAAFLRSPFPPARISRIDVSPARTVDGDVDGAFAAATHVITETFDQHRHANVPMECRGGVADYDAGTGDLTFYAAHQNPHQLRSLLGAAIGQPTHQLRVLCRDIGGSFGEKSMLARQE